jgi:hypothetical protein
MTVDSGDSCSPVKRLITMYNSTGAAAQKASRRKAKVKLDTASQNKDDSNIAKTTGQGEGSEEIQSVTDSADNSPQIDSDEEVGWANDDFSIDKVVPECSVEKKAISKPLSLDVSRDNIADLDEIHWEVIIRHNTFTFRYSIY